MIQQSQVVSHIKSSKIHVRITINEVKKETFTNVCIIIYDVNIFPSYP